MIQIIWCRLMQCTLLWTHWDSRMLRLWLPRQDGRTEVTAMRSDRALRMPRPTMGIWLRISDHWLGHRWCQGNRWTRISLHSTMRIWNPVQRPNGHLGCLILILPWHTMLVSQRPPRWEKPILKFIVLTFAVSSSFSSIIYRECLRVCNYSERFKSLGWWIHHVNVENNDL